MSESPEPKESETVVPDICIKHGMKQLCVMCYPIAAGAHTSKEIFKITENTYIPKGMVIICKSGEVQSVVNLIEQHEKALKAERLRTLEISQTAVIQVLNDYPDITVQDLAYIKNDMFRAFDSLIQKEKS